MEILQFLISFFLNEYGGKFKPILEELKNNNFDFKKTLSNLNLEVIAPIIKEFMENNIKNRPAENLQSEVGLSPIINVADNEIVQTLNKYFYQD